MKISEIFYSIQGEGRNTGIAMVFVRLAGCNLRCEFCDTSYAFDSGYELSAPEVVVEAKKYASKWVCITGGEPFMQDLQVLTELLKLEGLNIQIETNGTIYKPVACDWLVVSPKSETEPDSLMLKQANEIKMVIDSEEALERAKAFEKWGEYYSLQPASNREDMMALCVDFVKANPSWRLSVQLHKLIGID
ncbi:MAG: 7-carboxy-7-deazaguanine synthase QueE [Candidatus Aquicultor sp.]|nr:7-carboxy-7-deazaguanine synthase QueE [Candidatus Aquicultor sp.]